MVEKEITAPVIETQDEYEEFQRRSIERLLPGLMVNFKHGRKYATVEFDFVLVAGWRRLERESKPDSALPAELTEEATAEVQEILDGYEEHLAPSEPAVPLTIGKNASFFSTPKMELNAAKRLANELKPVINDRSNWQIYPTHKENDPESIVIPERLR